MSTGELPIVVIAAAGRAKRFGGVQKVLAEVAGIPAICRVARICEEAIGPHRQVVVIGHEGAQVRAALGEAQHRSYVVQHPLLGTGHSLMAALAHVSEGGDREVYFVCGDKPLLSPESVGRLKGDLDASDAAMVFLTGALEGDPTQNRQGRVLQAYRGTPQAEVLGIVERASIDALDDGGQVIFTSRDGLSWCWGREELLATTEVNLSAYVWRESVLGAHVNELPVHPEKGEYFVTDLVAILRHHQLLVRAISAGNQLEGIGIDTAEHLAAAERAWQHLQASGRVTSQVDGEKVADAMR